MSIIEQQPFAMDSLKDESVASLPPDLQEPSYSTTSHPAHGTAEVGLQMIPGEMLSHMVTDDSSFRIQPISSNDAQTHFDPIQQFLSTEGWNSSPINVQVCVNGQVFQIQRLPLVTFSPYFRELNAKGQLKPQCTVVMDFISPKGFAQVLHWINTADLELNKDNVEEVLTIAKVLGIRQIVYECQLCIRSMSECKKKNRSVTQGALTKHYTTAGSSISSILQINRRSTKREQIGEPDYQPKMPYFKLSSDIAFICFGGKTSSPKVNISEIASQIYAFNVESNEWNICGALPAPRADAAVCLLGNSAILTGGCNPGDRLASTCKTTWKLDIVTGSWEVLPYMPTARRLHGQVVVDGRVYVVGGCGDGCLPIESMECYNPATKEWTEAEPPHVSRFAAAVACHCGKIWVCGGVTGEDESRKITDQVEVYDPSRKTWSREKSLPLPRAFCDLLSVDNSMLLIVGGVEADLQSGEIHVTSTILTFDFEDRQWRCQMNLPYRRCKAKVVSRDPYWFVVGGERCINGPALSTVECFDSHNQKWMTFPKLPVPLQGTCCIVLAFYSYFPRLSSLGTAFVKNSGKAKIVKKQN